MKKTADYSMVFVTAPDKKVARQLARAALEKRLVACANLVAGMESHYWWQGKLERSAEILIIFKTTTRRLAALEKLVLAQHPYDTPEFVVVPVSAGTDRYLNWIMDSTKPMA